MIARLRASFLHDKPVLPALMMGVLFLSLPNLLAAFWPKVDAVQAESFWLGIGLILLPAVFSVPVRTTLLLWLPLAAVMPSAMIYNLYAGSPLREWAFLVLMETDQKELERFATGALAGLALAIPTAWFALCFIRRRLPARHRLGWLSRSAVVLFALLIPLGNLKQRGWELGVLSTQRKLSATFPVGPVVSVLAALSIRGDLDRRPSLAQQVQVRPPATSSRQIVVLVLGESARAASFQLNGYERETTPLLLKTEGVLSFRDVIAPATVTLMSVPLIMTPARAPWLGRASGMPSLVSVFKQAGYHTAWLSTQRKHGRYDTASSIYAHDADEQHFLSGIFAPGDGAYAGVLDGDLLQPVDQLIKRGHDKLLIILHTMGSHQHYSDRYPPEFNHFPSVPAKCEPDPLRGGYTEDQITNLTNAYDNSIRYTDWFLAQVIERLKAAQCVSTLVYVADHGQNTGRAKMLPFAHGTMTRDVVQVPMIAWLSEAHHQQFPTQANALKDRVNTPLSADATFHLLADLAGLQCDLVDSTRSAASPAFAPGQRLIRTLDGAVVDFDEAVRTQVAKSR
jgi:glucan phosphoethanolaminetransferase (alkaline phosphatase superfamily)